MSGRSNHRHSVPRCPAKEKKRVQTRICFFLVWWFEWNGLVFKVSMILLWFFSLLLVSTPKQLHIFLRWQTHSLLSGSFHRHVPRFVPWESMSQRWTTSECCFEECPFKCSRRFVPIIWGRAVKTSWKKIGVNDATKRMQASWWKFAYIMKNPKLGNKVKSAHIEVDVRLEPTSYTWGQEAGVK